jgi:hypothetical protein
LSCGPAYELGQIRIRTDLEKAIVRKIMRGVKNGDWERGETKGSKTKWSGEEELPSGSDSVSSPAVTCFLDLGISFPRNPSR